VNVCTWFTAVIWLRIGTSRRLLVSTATKLSSYRNSEKFLDLWEGVSACTLLLLLLLLLLFPLLLQFFWLALRSVCATHGYWSSTNFTDCGHWSNVRNKGPQRRIFTHSTKHLSEGLYPHYVPINCGCIQTYHGNRISFNDLHCHVQQRAHCYLFYPNDGCSILTALQAVVTNQTTNGS
jgi:hypothetical protein